MKIEIEISDDAYKLLLKIAKKEYVEYRDRYDDLEDFKKSDEYSDQDSIDKFLRRNFNGTQNLAWELSHFNFIKHDDSSFTTTFIITDLGKSVVDNHRERMIDIVLKEK